MHIILMGWKTCIVKISILLGCLDSALLITSSGHHLLSLIRENVHCSNS